MFDVIQAILSFFKLLLRRGTTAIILYNTKWNSNAARDQILILVYKRNKLFRLYRWNFRTPLITTEKCKTMKGSLEKRKNIYRHAAPFATKPGKALGRNTVFLADSAFRTARKITFSPVMGMFYLRQVLPR